METKKVVYIGDTTDEVTQRLEAGNDRMAAKGWALNREDMLSSTMVQVTYTRGQPDEEEEEIDPSGGGSL